MIGECGASMTPHALRIMSGGAINKTRAEIALRVGAEKKNVDTSKSNLNIIRVSRFFRRVLTTRTKAQRFHSSSDLHINPARFTMLSITSELYPRYWTVDKTIERSINSYPWIR
jgi:hypothetical protein